MPKTRDRKLSRWNRARLGVRQLTSYRGFLLRRSAAEAAGIGLLKAGTSDWLPRAAREPLLRLAHDALPKYPEPRLALGRLLLNSGDSAAAIPVLREAADFSGARREQPVLYLMARELIARFGVTWTSRQNFDGATAEGVRAARAAGDRAAEAEFLALRVEGLDEADSADALCRLWWDADELAQWLPETRTMAKRFPELPNAVAAYARALRLCGAPDVAHALLNAERHRYPGAERVWVESLHAAAAVGDSSTAHRVLSRLIRIVDDPVLYAPLALDPNPTPRAIRRRSAWAAKLKWSRSSAAVGDELELSVRVAAHDRPRALILVPPPGIGLAPEQPLVPIEAGQTALTVRVRACRPSRINRNLPWSLTAVVTDGTMAAGSHTALEVSDPRPGRAFVIITDDHELHDGRLRSTVDEVRRVLVDKAALAYRLAEAASARWGMMVEASGVALLEWAAEQAPEHGWAEVSRAYRDLLIDAVHRGHDLGLHIHAFYDPESAEFSQRIDARDGALRSEGDFVFAGIDGRRFWHRAYPTVGDWQRPDTKRGSLLRGLERVESLGRLGDPEFRVALFRAGSYDVGKDAAALRSSSFAIRDAGILADSDVKKSRFYTQFEGEFAFYAEPTDLRRPVEDLRDAGLVELIAEYNTEGDFLSDAAILGKYVEGRQASWTDENGQIKPGVWPVVSITHTKFINFRRGLEEASLDPEYGDWPAIQSHLEDLKARGLNPCRIREAVDAWVDDRTPEPHLVRGEETIVASAPGEEECELRFSLRVLGADIPIDGRFAYCASVRAPSWAARECRELVVLANEIEVARVTDPGFEDIPVWLDTHGPWEMRLRVPVRMGVVAEATDGGIVQLSAELPFRQAHVWAGGTLYRDTPFEIGPEGPEGRRVARVSAELNSPAPRGTLSTR